MCGIAGIINFNNSTNLSNQIAPLWEGIKHRGPDGHQHYISPDEHHLFVHALLKIMDKTSQSAQPVKDAAGNAMVFNGSIYNYQQLKKNTS